MPFFFGMQFEVFDVRLLVLSKMCLDYFASSSRSLNPISRSWYLKLSILQWILGSFRSHLDNVLCCWLLTSCLVGKAQLDLKAVIFVHIVRYCEILDIFSLQCKEWTFLPTTFRHKCHSAWMDLFGAPKSYFFWDKLPAY